MKRKYEWLILLAGVLLLVVSNAINYSSEEPMAWSQRLLFLLGLAIGISMQFSTAMLIGQWMQRRMPGLPFTLRRILRAFLLTVPALTVLMTLSDLALNRFSSNPVYDFGPNVLLLNLTQSAVTAIFILGLAEAFYYFEQLRRSEKEREELLRVSLAAQYDSLKQQVNPHFLFNSLNSLSSLISIDPPRAEKFVEELSQVYRYLLQSNEQELTSLGRELDFIKSYLHLLQTRFGEGFQVEIEVGQTALSCQIPPLTLQLLVENAVKHNEASTANPLRLRIVAESAERLVVSNNLQRRSISVPSAQVGLANIIARYRLLNHPFVEVKEMEGRFVVVLPLIQKPSQ
jgi:two-component system, LytTR family, sensor kinase